LVTNKETEKSRLDIYNKDGLVKTIELPEHFETAICLSKSPSSDLMLVSCKTGLVIIEDKEIVYEVNTSFELRLAALSHNEERVLIVDE
jgi:hypothetical protein